MRDTPEQNMKELELVRQLLLKQIAEAEVLFPSDEDRSHLVSIAALHALDDLIRSGEMIYSPE